jgi:P4 family phage/plasmid primase-like protien
MNFSNMNDGANFWNNDIGVNTIPADTKNKKPFINWKEYQEKPVSEETFEQWKRDDAFEKGLAIIPGKIWRGKNKGKYLIAIDIDKEKGLREFLTINGKFTTIEEFASKTLVEQRRDNNNRAHLFFISPIPFPSKGTDPKIGIEVKGEGSHGLIFVSPSIHQNGYPYEIIGTKDIADLQYQQALKLIRHIDDICVKNGLKYLEKENNSKLTPQINEMINRLKIDTTVTIHEGERHMTLLSLANSLLINHYIKPVDELKKFFENINNNLCKPYPLTQNEIDDIWESAIKYTEIKREHYNNINENEDAALSKKENLIEDATEQILSSHHLLTIEESKEILYYQNGVYIKGGETLIEKELEKHYCYQLNAHKINEIKGHIKRKTYTKFETFDKDLNIINLKNGLYDIETETLEPHSPNYYSIKQKPIAYNKNIKPKLFGRFLKEVLYPTQIRMAIEIMAYTFLRQHLYELYFILVGKGANGKSVFTGLLTELQGLDNVSNVPLQSLLEDRFALADLENKDANVDTELSSATIKDMSILKRLTGKQKQRIQRKGKDAYDISLYAKLFFNANTLPEIYDDSDATIRRQTILSFPNQFEEGRNADPRILEKLTTEDELSGIFNILMIALKRILKNNMVYLNQKTIQEKRERLELMSNSIKFFMDEA